MVRIKLKRGGATNDAHFKIVVVDTNRVGFILDNIGHYHPKLEGNNKVFFNIEKFEKWVQNGSQPTETVAKLAHNYGIESAKKFKKIFTPRAKGEFTKKKKK